MKKLLISVMLVILTLQISWACTFVEVSAKDGGIAIGRTIEWSFDVGHRFLVLPRGFEYTADYPKDKVAKDFKPLTWKNKYAMAGTTTISVPFGFVTAQNDAGLSFDALNLPTFSEYQTITENDRNVLSLNDLPVWMLGNFKNTDEVKSELPKYKVFAADAAQGSTATLHIVVTDRAGKGIVLEYVKGQLNIYDNVTNTLTNSPPYNWHLELLRNYLNLTNADKNIVEQNGIRLHELSTGDGMVGIPGDFTSVSRFTKISIFRSFVAPVNTTKEACELAGHLINTVDIPKGTVYSGDYKNQPLYETAQVTAIKDLKNNIIYLSDYDHRLNYVFIDLKKLFALNRKIGPIPFSVFDNPAPIDVTNLIK